MRKAEMADAKGGSCMHLPVVLRIQAGAFFEKLGEVGFIIKAELQRNLVYLFALY